MRRKKLRRRLRRQGKSRRQQVSLAVRRSPGKAALRVTRCVAPPLFALYKHDSHRKLVGFVRELVKLALIDEQTVEIDFRPVHSLYPDGTLLVLAEVHRILARRPGCLRFIRATTKIVDETLCHIGLYRLLGYSGQVPSDSHDVLHWQPISGKCGGVEVELAPRIESQGRMPEATRKALTKGVSEAIVNVTQHAYDCPRDDGTGLVDESGWWAFVREEKDSLTIVSCDLGLGVPMTVWKNRWEHIVEFQKRLARAIGRQSHQDGQIIRAAVDESRSRTRLDYRGNGFRDILDSVISSGQGEVRIFSNRGCYYAAVSNGRESHSMRNYKHSIFGTLIAWRIGLQEEST